MWLLQNQHLEAQLRDMEQERERLREMLAGDKTIASPGATGSAPDSPYLPPGLPSKVSVFVKLHSYYK